MFLIILTIQVQRRGIRYQCDLQANTSKIITQILVLAISSDLSYTVLRPSMRYLITDSATYTYATDAHIAAHVVSGFPNRKGGGMA